MTKNINRKTFYAHSTDHPISEEWHKLSEHLTGVGRLAGKFGDVFGAAEAAKTAGLLHDLGKYTREFQDRLQGNPQRVHHSTHCAQVACERSGSIGKLLAYATCWRA